MTVKQRIRELAADFNRNPKNYRVEEELRSRLSEYLRADFDPTTHGHEKVRVQFPVWKNSYEHYDIAILTANAAIKYADGYGWSVTISTKYFYSFYLFEIKQKGSILQEKSDTDADIKRLIAAIQAKRAQYAYMLIFLHGGNTNSAKAKKALKQYANYTGRYPNLYIYCIFGGTPSDFIYLHSGIISHKEFG